MARLITSGFEANDFSTEGWGTSPRVTIDATVPRSGSFCAALASSSALSATVSWTFPAGALARDYFLRAGVRISANPANAVPIAAIVATGGGSTPVQVVLNTSGTLDLQDSNGTKIGSSSAALTPGTWYRVEVRCQVNAATTGVCELRVDGTTVTGTNVSNANLGTTAPSIVKLGWSTSTQSTATIFIDDIALNDSVAGAGGTSWPGDGKIVMLNPTANSAIGTGWTNDAATTTTMWDAVNNEPPVGIADTTVGSGLHQVRNATSNANSAYVASLTTYTAAGLASTDTITLMQWIVATGVASATSPKSGSARILSNPVDTGLVAFTPATFGTAVAGTYPSNWVISRGAVTDSTHSVTSGWPVAANYGTAPTMSLNQVTASTRIAMCCLMGVIVEYVPGAGGGTSSTADTSLTATVCSRVLALARSLTDTSVSSDAVSPAKGYARSTTNTTLSADAVTRSPMLYTRSTADTSVSSDAATRVSRFPRATADTSLSADAVPRRLALPRSTSDTSLSTDTLTRTLSLPRLTADTSVTSDAISAAKGYARSTTDTSSSSDTVTRVLALARSTADTSLTSDVATSSSAAHLTRSAGDTSLSADALTTVSRFPRSEADTSTTSDALTRFAQLPRPTSDTSLSSDATARGARFTRSATDTSLSSDHVTTTGPQGPPAPRITPPTTATISPYASAVAIAPYRAAASVYAYTSTCSLRAYFSLAALRTYSSGAAIVATTTTAMPVSYTSSARIGPTLG